MYYTTSGIDAAMEFAKEMSIKEKESAKIAFIDKLKNLVVDENISDIQFRQLVLKELLKI